MIQVKLDMPAAYKNASTKYQNLDDMIFTASRMRNQYFGPWLSVFIELMREKKKEDWNNLSDS